MYQQSEIVEQVSVTATEGDASTTQTLQKVSRKEIRTFLGKLYSWEASFQEYQIMYDRFLISMEDIFAELNSRTIEQLIGRKSIPSHIGNKKDLINQIVDDYGSGFYLFDSMRINPFSGETSDQVRTRNIKALTEKQFDERIAALKQKEEEKAARLANPQSIMDYWEIIWDRKGSESNPAAVLSPDELAHYERLQTDSIMEQQDREEDRKATVSQVDMENTDFTLAKETHTKNDTDIWVVRMSDRVETSTFRELRGKAKRFSGYYSRYSKGFVFNCEEDATDFMAIKDGNVDNTDRFEAMKQARQDRATNRMQGMAAGIEERARESLHQDRKDNTFRRARMAAAAENQAQTDLRFAAKLEAIAQGIADGSVKYLKHLRNQTQLHELLVCLSQGYYNRERSEWSGPSGIRWQEKNEPDPLKDIPYVKFPYPCYSEDVIKGFARDVSDRRGAILAARRVLKTRPSRNGLMHFRLDSQIEDLKIIANALRKPSERYSRERIMGPVEAYDRLVRMKIMNLAMLRTALRELANLKGAVLTEEEKAMIKLRSIERQFVGSKIPGFFPTPGVLAAKMVDLAGIKPGDEIIEPEAGLGHVADLIRIRYPDNQLTVCEINPSLCEALEQKGYTVSGFDFLEHLGKYDKIIMNPPFEDNQDIEHVRHAFSLLKEGGTLVATVAGNKKSERPIVTEFMEFVNEHGYLEENPKGSFLSSLRPTGVHSSTVVLFK